LREYTEQAVREDAVGRPWERLVAGIVLGTEAFARRLRQETGGNAREQPQLKRLSFRQATGKEDGAAARIAAD
jgi:hypothetical protein